MTLANGSMGTTGTITAANSVLGLTAGGGNTMTRDYDYVHDQLVVGRPTDSIVTLFRPSGPPVPVHPVFLPLLVRGGS